MGFIPRRRIKENLRQIEVFLEDTDNRIFVVQDLPDTFVQGRSAFKIFGSEFLKEVPLKIEILDKAGNTVWTQPVNYGQEQSPNLPYRYISVEVYPPPINVPGEAELVIVGELNENLIDVEPRFVGTYNVRYSKIINIDTEKVINEQPILFYKKPQITAREFVTLQKKTNAPDNRFISGSQLYGLVNSDIRGTAFVSSSEIDTQTVVNDRSESPRGDLETQANLWKYKTGLYKQNKTLKRRGLKQEKKSPEPPQMTIFSNESKFVSKMIGGNVTISGITLPTSSVQSLTGLTTDVADIDDIFNSVSFPNFTSRVEDVISDTELNLTKPYSIEYTNPIVDGASVSKIYSDIGSVNDSIFVNFTASYVDWEVPTTSSYRFDSFVDFTIEDMRTFSGDVYRIKVAGGSDSSLGDFPVLLDTVVDSPELLVDTTSPSGVLRSGYFIDQTHIDKYWNTFGGNNNANQLNANYTMSLADGMYLSGSYEEFNQVGRVDLDSTYAFTVRKDVAYTLSFNAKAKKATKNNVEGDSYQSARMFLHLSGSNLKDFNESDIQYSSSFGNVITDEFGRSVGLEIDDDDPITTFKDLGRINHTFTPNFKLDRIKNTDTILQLRIHSGEWIISDLSLAPAASTGFSPDEFKFRVPINPNTLRPDNFDFIIEYLDINGNTAETITFLDDIAISGSALVLEGDDNLMTGSMFMGSAQGEGIEMAGANSAYIRSVGYQGFISASAGEGGGFFMWSGSVLPNAPDNYRGAGLEIHDGITGDNESFLKFRTIDADNDNSSSFEVRTSKFFLGGGSQFVSGSDGNIEISSSNFHLTPEGQITASAGKIAGFEISGTKLRQGNVFEFDGASDANFFISSSKFQVDTLGNMTGSEVLISGGTITDGVTILGSVSANSILTPATIAGVPATATNASSSIDSQGFAAFRSASIGGFVVNDTQIKSSNDNLILKDSGQITGSTVQFIGGTIAGFTIDGTKLKQGSSFEFDGASDADFFISASNFQVDTSGNLTGSQVLISGGTITDGVSILGSVSANSILVPATIGGSPAVEGNASASISAQGFASFKSASIASFRISPDAFFTDSFFISSSATDNDFFISSSNFNVKASGDITGSAVLFDGGKIAGFTIDDNNLTATNFSLEAANKKISLGTGNTIFIADADEGIQLGHATFASAPFSVTKAGVIKATSGTIGGFNLSTSTITSENLIIDSDGTLETADFASNVQGWRISSIDNGMAEFENAKIRGTLSTAVFEKETVNAVGGQLYVANSSALTGSGMISASYATMSVVNSSGFTGSYWGSSAYYSDWSAGVDGWSSGHTQGVQDGVSDGTTSKNDVYRITVVAGVGLHSLRDINLTVGKPYLITLTYLIPDAGSTGGANGGVDGFRFSIGDSSDRGLGTYSPGVIGTWTTARLIFTPAVTSNQFRIYPTDGTSFSFSGGSAQIGDLVFISEFSVQNRGDGEILSLKKVTSTGFSTEYVKIESASRDDPSSDTNLAGKLYVVRGYSGSAAGSATGEDSGSVGESAGSAQSYQPGQVIVSTGRISTGYIRLNANPNDVTTPYIDIVERTGSGVYDIDLKARLGDLSGLSSTRLHGTSPSSAGFGLYSQNVFLEGGIVANTGSIAGIEMESNKLYIGTGTHNNSNTAFYVDNTGKFSLKDKLVWDGSNLAVAGSITITGGPSAAQLAALNEQSSSLQSQVNTIGDTTSSLQSGVNALGDATSSLATGITNVGASAVASSSLFVQATEASASLFAVSALTSGSQATASLQSGINSLGDATSSLQTGVNALGDATSSLQSGVNSLGEATSSLATGITNVGASAITSASLFADSAVNSGSLFADSANASASLYATSVNASASAVAIQAASDLAAVSSSTADRIMTDISGSIIETPPSPAGEGLFLNYPHMGFYSGSAFKAFISASGGFLFKADDDNLISFGQSNSGGDGAATNSFVLKSQNVFMSGSKINMLADKFFLGGSSAFISGSSGNIRIFSTGETTLSGSQVTLESPKFFMGSAGTQFVSGSEGKLEISSSRFIASPDGAVTIGDIGNEHSIIDSNGLTIKSGSTTRATFGDAITLNGASTNDQVVIDSNGVVIKQGGVGRVQLDSNILRLGRDGNARTLIDDDSISMYDGQGTSRKRVAIDNSGKIAVGGASNADVSVTSTDDVIRIDPGTGVFVFDDSNNFTQLDSTAFSIVKGGHVSASFATTTTIGSTSGSHVAVSGSGVTVFNSSNDFLNINSTDIKIVKGGQVSASFGTTTTIGPTGGSHVEISGSGVSIYGTNNEYLNMNSTDIQIVKGGQVSASFGATTTIGPAASAHVEISGSGVTVFSTDKTDSINITDGGIFVNENSQVRAIFGATTVLGSAGAAVTTTSTDDCIRIANGTVSIFQDNNNKAVVNSDGLTITQGGNTVGTFGANPIITGGTVTIRSSANNDDKVQVTADSFKVFDDGSEVGSFGATTTLGNTSNEHVQISGSGLELLDGSTQRFAINSSGVAVGDNFNVDASGNVSMSGVITAAAGNISTFTITSGSIDSDTTSTKRGLKLEPGKSIRGYGSVGHTTTTTKGKFSFSVGAIAPSATADVPFDPNTPLPQTLSGE